MHSMHSNPLTVINPPSRWGFISLNLQSPAKVLVDQISVRTSPGDVTEEMTEVTEVRFLEKEIALDLRLLVYSRRFENRDDTL